MLSEILNAKISRSLPKSRHLYYTTLLTTIALFVIAEILAVWDFAYFGTPQTWLGKVLNSPALWRVSYFHLMIFAMYFAVLSVPNLVLALSERRKSTALITLTACVFYLGIVAEDLTWHVIAWLTHALPFPELSPLVRDIWQYFYLPSIPAVAYVVHVFRLWKRAICETRQFAQLLKTRALSQAP